VKNKEFKTAPDCPVIPHPDDNFARGECCCNCEHQLKDYWQCTTVDQDWRDDYEAAKGEKPPQCVCNIVKGYICVPPGFIKNGRRTAHSNWSEHGMCEMHERRILRDNNGEPIPLNEGTKDV